MAVRKATAVWEGTFRQGKGRMALGSGAFEGPFSFSTRFEETPGTNPEELVGAALAGCFSMQLGAFLEKAGHPADRLETTAKVHLDKVGDGFSITRIELDCQGHVPGIDEQTFKQYAEEAHTKCIVSRALSVDTTVNARLV